jgi:hypothetical protein
MLEQAVAHLPGVWVLKQHDGNPDEPVLAKLQRAASLQSELPKKSKVTVLHQVGCWETAAWDVIPSQFIMQLWRVSATSESRQQAYHHAVMQQLLDCEGPHRYAFHWCDNPAPPRLLIHRQHQQDALRHSWDGLVTGTDGSIDEHTEVMGAGYVLGVDPQLTISFFASVGGPLASARAEAASLLQLLRDVRQRYISGVHLLIFVVCLVILDILRKWGRSDFHPRPRDIAHFAVTYPLLQALRKWIGKVTLVKVKSHTGCLLNERADAKSAARRR